MLSKLIGEKKVYSLLLIAYAALACGITFNKVVLSLATMLLFLIVILEFNLSEYKSKIKNNRVIIVLLLFLILHLSSFFWSENTSYFWKDLNSKLPFYAIPLVFVLKPIQEKKHLILIFGVFLLSLFTISLINFISYYGWRKTEFDDVRSLSLFLSHIRFGLMIVFGIVLAFFWIFEQKLRFKLIPILLVLWFLVYTYFSEVLSSYLALFGVLMVFLIYNALSSKKKKPYILILVAFLLLCVSSIFYSYKTYKNGDVLPKIENLAKFTKEGNKYEHYLQHRYFINGNHVFSNISGIELFRDWPKYSKIHLNDTTANGANTYFVLIQYMTSKGLTKDAVGLKKLSEADIKNIELGKHKYNDDEDGIEVRIRTLFNEFRDDDPNGKTILQRIEHLKAGSNIYIKSPIFGIGSGDIQDEFDRYYEATNSKLLPENRLRTHNQIFTYFITFGLVGGILFLAIFFLSFKHFFKTKNLLAILFTTIILLSFLSEDTLETQMGGTFFALFFGLFISLPEKILKDEN